MIRATNRMRTRTLTTAATFALVLAVGACSNGRGGDDPSPVPTETSSSTPTESPTEPATPRTDAEKAVAALEAYLVVRDEAYRTGKIDKSLPEVADVQTHLALQETARFMREQKIFASAPYGHSLGDPKKESSTLYEIVDCEDWAVAKQTVDGEPAEPRHPNGDLMANPIATIYRVTLDDGKWKVSSTRFGRNEPCSR